MGIIYKITNKANGLSYIGQTVRSFNERWAEHISQAERFSDSHFHRALNKYGADSFQTEIIEEVENCKLNYREVYWIGVYDTYKNGYNSTLGGNSRTKYERNEIQRLWNGGLSFKEIAQITGCSDSTLSTIIKLCDGYSHEESAYRGLKGKRIPVTQYDNDGKYVNTYSSASDVERELGILASNVTACCNKAALSAGGFQWRYCTDLPPGKYPNINRPKSRLRKAVMQLSVDGSVIQSFESVTAASKKVGIHKSQIVSSCRHPKRTAAGYLWKYIDDVPKAII